MFGAGGEAREVVEVEAGALLESGMAPWFRAVITIIQSVQGRRHQPVAPPLALGLRRLQLVAQRHQFVHLRHDPVLFGEGRKRNRQLIRFRTI